MANKSKFADQLLIIFRNIQTITFEYFKYAADKQVKMNGRNPAIYNSFSKTNDKNLQSNEQLLS